MPVMTFIVSPLSRLHLRGMNDLWVFKFAKSFFVFSRENASLDFHWFTSSVTSWL